MYMYNLHAQQCNILSKNTSSLNDEDNVTTDQNRQSIPISYFIIIVLTLILREILWAVADQCYFVFSIVFEWQLLGDTTGNLTAWS